MHLLGCWSPWLGPHRMTYEPPLSFCLCMLHLFMLFHNLSSLPPSSSFFLSLVISPPPFHSLSISFSSSSSFSRYSTSAGWVSFCNHAVSEKKSLGLNMDYSIQWVHCVWLGGRKGGMVVGGQLILSYCNYFHMERAVLLHSHTSQPPSLLLQQQCASFTFHTSCFYFTLQNW